ncbi:MAG: glutamate-5-semialdehyde dehydrogenase [Candidatus Spyradocola sp.]
MTMVQDLGKRARAAALEMATLGSAARDGALRAMAQALRAHCASILQANAEDIRAAKEKGVKSAFVERLTLTEKRVEDMARGLMDVAALPDPIGTADRMWTRPNGLRILQKRVPLGVVGIIFESRPNVTSDAAAICIKSGNACILRGGSEAIRSNCAIMDALEEAARTAGLPEGAVSLVRDPSRAAAGELMRLNGLVDVLIPRGGEGLIRTVVETATVPVIETGTGNCHVYVDRDCRNLSMAFDVTYNAKLRRVSVCNAMETLLVHRAIAPDFLPEMLERFRKAGVEIRGCARTKALCPWVCDATEEDWRTEYDDYILAVRIVDSLDEAIDHINTYGTRHSESILTDDVARAQRFLDRVDAAAVYLNAPTSFTDGGEFGFGAEIGISNQKLHARGPMGPEHLTTIKYEIFGSGQIRP